MAKETASSIDEKYCKNCKQKVTPKFSWAIIGVGLLIFASAFVVRNFSEELGYSWLHCNYCSLIPMILMLVGTIVIIFGLVDKKCPICNSKNWKD